MPQEDWSSEQNDAIVADYFAMLAAEMSGRSYNKAEHNRALQSRIGRSRGSIEFKHRNISAVLKGLGEDWIRGYLPAFNIQETLVDAVARWLTRHPAWLHRPAVAHTGSPGAGVADDDALWIGPSPARSNAPPPDELVQMTRIAAKFDVAERDARNRALGKAGEERALRHEKATLSTAGRRDLAANVRWVSEEDGDGAGYDIASYELDGRPKLIEVKTTNGWERTPFHITRNELATADLKRTSWCLLRLWNFSRGPKAFELRPPLNAHISLVPNSFIGSWT